MAEDLYFIIINHLQPEMSMKNGQIPPDSLTRPWFNYAKNLNTLAYFGIQQGVSNPIAFQNMLA